MRASCSGQAMGAAEVATCALGPAVNIIATTALVAGERVHFAAASTAVVTFRKLACQDAPRPSVRLGVETSSVC